MAKFVNISVDDELVEPVVLDIGANHTSQIFETDGVSCAVSAGIGEPQGAHSGTELLAGSSSAMDELSSRLINPR
jgi:hypothetical protein